MQSIRICLAAFLTVALLVWTGCNSSASKPAHHDDHEHEHGKHAHPETYAEAVHELQELRDEIRESLAKGDTKTADPLVHEVGELLDEIPELAEKESFAPADVLAVKAAASELKGHFGKIDEKLHGKEGVTYDEVAKPIDAAVEALGKRPTKP